MSFFAGSGYLFRTILNKKPRHMTGTDRAADSCAADYPLFSCGPGGFVDSSVCREAWLAVLLAGCLNLSRRARGGRRQRVRIKTALFRYHGILDSRAVWPVVVLRIIENPLIQQLRSGIAWVQCLRSSSAHRHPSIYKHPAQLPAAHQTSQARKCRR